MSFSYGLFEHLDDAQKVKVETAENRVTINKPHHRDIAGDLIAGLLLTQILYWSGEDDKPSKLSVVQDGFYWLVKKREDWKSEIGITPAQYDRAIEVLEQKKLVVRELYKFKRKTQTHIRLRRSVYNLHRDYWKYCIGVDREYNDEEIQLLVEQAESRNLLHDEPDAEIENKGAYRDDFERIIQSELSKYEGHGSENLNECYQKTERVLSKNGASAIENMSECYQKTERVLQESANSLYTETTEENTSENLSETTPKRNSGQSLNESFDLFWKAYPKKVGKKKCLIIWKKIKPSFELTMQMIAVIGREKNTKQWQKDNGQFIPNPSTWLNQERWEDEPPEVIKAEKDKERDAWLEQLEEKHRRDSEMMLDPNFSL